MRVKQWIGMSVLLLLPVLAVATVYKWTDSAGAVHFTDQPRKGAEPIKLKELQVYTPAPEHKASADKAAIKDAASAKQDANRYPYQSVQITSPKNEATLRDTQGNVNVNVTLIPPLQKGDRVFLLLDNKALGEPKATTAFGLHGVVRGTHKLRAKVLNAQGKEIISSEEITFFMQQPRVQLKKMLPLHQAKLKKMLPINPVS